MNLPTGFVYLHEVDANIIQEMKYFTNDNFIGRPITGYAAPVCILTLKAAQQLSLLQQDLNKIGLGLKVFDGYRPQMAVNDFIVWSEDAADQKMKALFYPNVNKADFFELHYVAKKSSHTRGSTVDLTIIDLATRQELDMGTNFDYMDEASHPLGKMQGQARKNRLFLRAKMDEFGFDPIETEWWHFMLRDEPFPDTYFDFVVE